MPVILLVEDNPDVNETTCEMLEIAGYEVVCAHNGEEGLELASAKLPDLVLCDIWMPKADGYTVLVELQKAEPTRSIPFVFFTASAEPSEIRKGLEMGACGYLCKPFTEDELLDTLEKFLK